MHPYKTYSVSEARKKLEKYCTYQERCHKDVRKKLEEMKMIPDAIDQIIVHLLQHDYLNETRFAKTFARGKFRIKKWGKFRVVNELKIRGISKYNIDIALKEVKQSEYLDTFNKLAKKRYNQIANEESLQIKRKKLASYLLYRGWETELVWGKVKELTNP